MYVHPPGLPYALALVSWLSAELGFGLSRLLVTIIGAINILLICYIALRCSGLLPAIVAGSLYALHPAVVAAERGVVLEPLLIMFCLAAAALWLGSDQNSSRGSRSAWLSGVLLGCATVVKLWAVLAAIACLASSRRLHGWSDAGRLVAGAVAAFGILLLPVVLRSPMSFFEQVVVFQMKRPSDGPSDVADRFPQVFLQSASVVRRCVSWERSAS